MTEIREIGSLCSLDDKGYIINESDSEKINHKFQLAIQRTKESCLYVLPREIHSIYIRGSLYMGFSLEQIKEKLDGNNRLNSSWKW
ncbi:hypothetical protein [Lentibacillus sp. CBA3610]|uniref:hypothetical protein n=1 Tax=Lentibacillus sp. CBA3610 TaxID=2518176 RepID=UPI001594E80C|nr:hypothetical protein [Lentibacillus sp. CBA3610]QKY71336.1 hypothetical protein Len3610_18860 [Lentibacillus sp. CBA3610]